MTCSFDVRAGDFKILWFLHAARAVGKSSDYTFGKAQSVGYEKIPSPFLILPPLADDCLPSVDAPLQARENVGVVLRVVGCCHLSGLGCGGDSRRPVWEFADWVQITRSVLEAQW